jgi:hypothetical protein
VNGLMPDFSHGLLESRTEKIALKSQGFFGSEIRCASERRRESYVMPTEKGGESTPSRKTSVTAIRRVSLPMSAR